MNSRLASRRVSPSAFTIWRSFEKYSISAPRADRRAHPKTTRKGVPAAAVSQPPPDRARSARFFATAASATVAPLRPTEKSPRTLSSKAWIRLVFATVGLPPRTGTAPPLIRNIVVALAIVFTRPSPNMLSPCLAEEAVSHEISILFPDAPINRNCIPVWRAVPQRSACMRPVIFAWRRDNRRACRRLPRICSWLPAGGFQERWKSLISGYCSVVITTSIYAVKRENVRVST